ncbi:MAG: type II toxin-antitoxin system PemK/MazF family toxin [Thermoanaerobaculia bacterium]|nr:type II toxin-antitoxin system PemK/MazF family toxin [Thermoanaerobaculia bacterium]
MRRGDVYWIDFPSPVGRRPAVLVSRNEAYSVRSRSIVVPLTRTVRGIPTEVRLGPTDGLPKAGVANADEVVTVPNTLLRSRITTLAVEQLEALDRALAFALGLETH